MKTQISKTKQQILNLKMENPDDKTSKVPTP